MNSAFRPGMCRSQETLLGINQVQREAKRFLDGSMWTDKTTSYPVQRQANRIAHGSGT